MLMMYRVMRARLRKLETSFRIYKWSRIFQMGQEAYLNRRIPKELQAQEVSNHKLTSQTAADSASSPCKWKQGRSFGQRWC